MTVRQLIAEPLIVNKICKKRQEIEDKVDEIMEILSTLLPVRWERQGKTITIDNKTKNTNY